MTFLVSNAVKTSLRKVCSREGDKAAAKARSGQPVEIGEIRRKILKIEFSHVAQLPLTTAARSVTTLQETLAAQVPEKQKKLAQLKKEHGSQV